MCHVHVSIPCMVGSCYFITYFIHILVLSLSSFPPPGDPTDDQLSDEPVFDPETVYDVTPAEE